MNKNLTILGISLISFTAFLDFTIVNVALPTIQKSLALPITQLQWVISLYFLGNSIFMVTMGKLGDIFGVRRILFAGAIIFAIASLICGTAINGLWLFTGRFIQGVAVASLYTLSFVMLSLVFTDEKQRFRAISINGTINGLGIALGPSLGGFILNFVNWRWIFLMNIPIIIVGLFISAYHIPKFIPTSNKVKIDYIAMLLLAFSIGGLMFGLTNGAEMGWTNVIPITSFIIAIVAFISLIPWELHQTQPLISFHYFTKTYFIASILLCVIGGLIVSVMLFFDPLFLQVIRNDSVIKTGLVLLALPAMIIISPSFINRALQHFSKINIVIFSAGCAALGALLHANFSINSPLWFLLLAFILVGITWAIVNILTGLTAQAAVSAEEYGSATGTSFTFFNITAAVGIALVVALFHLVENNHLTTQLVAQHISLSSDQLSYMRTLLSQPEKLNSLLSSFGNNSAIISNTFKSAFMSGFHAVMWLLFAVAVLILGALLRIKTKIHA